MREQEFASLWRAGRLRIRGMNAHASVGIYVALENGSALDLRDECALRQQLVWKKSEIFRGV